MFSLTFTLTLKSRNWDSVSDVKREETSFTADLNSYQRDLVRTGPEGYTDFIFKIQLMHCFDSTVTVNMVAT